MRAAGVLVRWAPLRRCRRRDGGRCRTGSKAHMACGAARRTSRLRANRQRELSTVHDRDRHRVRRPHAGRQLQRRLRGAARPCARHGRHQGGDGACRRPPGRGGRGHPGPDPHRWRGAEPGAAGRRRGGHPGGADGLRHQPALRLGPAGGGAGGAADRHRRCRHRGGRRAGEHDPGAARAEPPQRAEDGAARTRGHHAEGRAVGRLPGVPHGHHRRERGGEVPDSPARSRTISPRRASARRARRSRPGGSRTRSCR